MVWRTDIEVLGMKAKASPLLISMLLHMLVMGVFAFTNKEEEKVFHVELIMQDIRNIYQPQIKQSFRKSPRPSVISGDTDYSLPREEKTEIKIDSDSKRETLPVVENSNTDTVLAKSTVPIRTSGDNAVSEKSLPDAKAGGDSTAKIIGHGSAVIETEFGSANAPSFVKKVMPEYPRFAKRLGKEGKVVLRLFIDEHGRLVNVEIIEKAGYGFDEASVNAVKASTFRPAKLNGHPVACKALLPVRFKLE